MKHILFIETAFGNLCAGCGNGGAFLRDECDLQQLKEEIFELYFWLRGSDSTSFSTKLFELFQKADPINYMALDRAFPRYSAALTLWKRTEENELFYAINIMKRPQGLKRETPETEVDEHETAGGIG